MHPDDTQFRDMFRRMVFSKKEENKKVIVEMTLRPVLALQNNKIWVQASLKALSSVIVILA